MRKDDLNMHVFFLTLTVRGPSHGKYFKLKQYGGTGLLSKKTEVLYAELNERAEPATSSYSAAGDFFQYIYSLIMITNHQKIRSRCLVHEFSIKDFFNDINHGYKAAILKKKLFMAASVLYGCGYLLLLRKGAQHEVQCNFIVPP